MEIIENELITKPHKSKHFILDACCGGRLFWFDKTHPNAIYMDKRSEEFIACDGRSVSVRPDVIGDFRKMTFHDKSFKLVVFDPPHDIYAGKKSFTYQKYGNLNKESWRTDLKCGFDECMRVLDDYGILIFKWNELRINVNEIITVFDAQPLFGHKSGKANKTHWLAFMKIPKP